MPYADVNGLRLYYEEQGDGPPLVLLAARSRRSPEPRRPSRRSVTVCRLETRPCLATPTRLTSPGH
jgi:hypothetical protein